MSTEIKGTHIAGHGAGKKLGFPTINIEYEGELRGVFAGKVWLEDQWMIAAVHIGKRLTMNDDKVSCEIHVLNWRGEVPLGQEIEVKLGEKIRDTEKFSGLDELKKQIAKDIESVKKKV